MKRALEISMKFTHSQQINSGNFEPEVTLEGKLPQQHPLRAHAAPRGKNKDIAIT